MNSYDEARLQANLAIVEVIKNYIEHNPSIRFHQALTNLEILQRFEIIPKENGESPVYVFRDEVFTEPWDVLKRMGK